MPFDEPTQVVVASLTDVAISVLVVVTAILILWWKIQARCPQCRQRRAFFATTTTRGSVFQREELWRCEECRNEEWRRAPPRLR